MNEAQKLKTTLLNNRQYVPFEVDGTSQIEPLGSGESNDNYIAKQGPHNVVLRVSKGKNNTLKHEYEILKLLPSGTGPAAYFYSEQDDLAIVAEEYIEGVHITTWTDDNIRLLVKALATTHSITSATATIQDKKVTTINLTDYLDNINRAFEGVDTKRTMQIKEEVYKYCTSKQVLFDGLHEYSLIHGDLAPLNTLYSESKNDLRVIDWEYAQYFDPARDFATFFYDGIDYNDGKWRVRFDNRQQALLVDTYLESTGCNIAERLNIWLQLDKYNSLVWLNWKIETFDSSDRLTLSEDELQLEFDKILGSMKLQ